MYLLGHPALLGPKAAVLSSGQQPYVESAHVLIMADSVHEWYERNLPSAALLGTRSRRDETILANLRIGYNRAQRHAADLKVYLPCLNSIVTQATPTYILACISCHKSQLL
ncbi:hypothetical protein TNCV_4334401 [Trichonephila clavipes]|nr:hypothetical protein TNCV_4334401 [Trichonephila clavipes]